MAGGTRRDISMKGATYRSLKRKAAAESKTATGLLEELIDAKMNELGVPPETVLLPKVPRGEVPRVTDGGRFTF